MALFEMVVEVRTDEKLCSYPAHAMNWDWLSRAKAGDPWVYFVQGAGGGPIKIGFTTRLHGRLKELQTGFPLGRLNVIALLSGGVELEQDLHARFKSARIESSEWFWPTEALMRCVHEELRFPDALCPFGEDA